MNSVREFAERNRLRVNDRRLAAKHRIRPGEDVVLGRFGEIAEVDGRFRVRFLAVSRNAVMTGALRNRHRVALRAGLNCKWKVDGGSESIFEFDPEIPEQVSVVVRLVGAKYRRKSTPASPEVLKRLRVARECRFLSERSIKTGVVEMNGSSIGIDA